MLEFIAIAIDIILKSLDLAKIQTLNDQKTARKVARELYTLYMNLHAVMTTGTHILSELQAYVSEADGVKPSRTEEYDFIRRRHLGTILNSQAQSLDNAITQVRDHYSTLTNLKTDFGDSITSRRMSKQSMLGQLKRLFQESLISWDLENGEYARRFLADGFVNINYTNPANVNYELPWNKDIYDRLKLERSNRQHRAIIRSIRTFLRQLREEMDRKFSVKDILLDL